MASGPTHAGDDQARQGRVASQPQGVRSPRAVADFIAAFRTVITA